MKVTQSCPTVCDPMDCRMPGFPVHHQWSSRSLLKLRSIESVMPSNHLILGHPLLLLPSTFPSIRVFSVSQFFASGGQSIRASASASVLNSPGQNTGVGSHSLFEGSSHPGIELRPPALQVDSLPAELPGKPLNDIKQATKVTKHNGKMDYVKICQKKT